MAVFFFQAEDGIRHLTVTGVQTCALPICGLGLTSLLGVFVRYIQSAATIGQVEMPQNAPHPAIFARLMNSDPAHIFVTLPDSDSNARQGGKGWAGRVLRWMGADVPLDRSKDS